MMSKNIMHFYVTIKSPNVFDRLPKWTTYYIKYLNLSSQKFTIRGCNYKEILYVTI